MREKVAILVFSLVFFFGVISAFDIGQDIKNLCVKHGNKPNKNISAPCLDQMKIVCDHPALFYSLFDASSKFPYVGMNYSSNFDYGNYRYCHSIDFTDKNGDRVLGKHCPMSLGVLIPLVYTNPKEAMKTKTDSRIASYEEMDRLISMHQPMQYDMFRSKPKDEVWSFNMSLLTLCIPDACSPNEVVDFFITLPKSVESKLVGEHIPCTTIETHKQWTTGSKWTVGVFAAIVGIAAISTLYDVYLHYSNKKPIHMVTRAYSVLYNFKKIITVVPPKDRLEQIGCLNGFRGISMMWIVAGHSIITWNTFQLVNKVETDHALVQFRSWYLQTAHIAVDTFFYISGLLLGFLYLKQMRNTPMLSQIKSIPYFYFHRYLRITPAVAALFFWSRYILIHLGEGPFWATYVKYITGSCEKYWWSYFLYVQNYVNPDKLCMTQTWYLSADMQMFVFSPLILIPASVLIKRSFKTVMALMGVITLASIVIPLALRFRDHPGYDTYDTHSRLVDYLIGLTMGFYLRHNKNSRYPFNKLWNFIIWVFVLAAMIGILLVYTWVVLHDTDFNDALFFGLYRTFWCLGLSWIVFSCYYGYGGFVDWILSNPLQVVSARLSYSVYLIHNSIILIYFGSMASPMYFSEWNAYYAWCGHIINATILATAWSLLFESPIITLEKLIFPTAAPRPKPVQNIEAETKAFDAVVDIKESKD